MEMTKEQHEAELVKEVLKMDGWKVIVRAMADKQEALRKAWLHSTDADAAEKIRQKALGLTEFLRTLALILNRGKGEKTVTNPPPVMGQGEPNGNESIK
jgi:hypothetical protein